LSISGQLIGISNSGVWQSYSLKTTIHGKSMFSNIRVLSDSYINRLVSFKTKKRGANRVEEYAAQLHESDPSPMIIERWLLRNCCLEGKGSLDKGCKTKTKAVSKDGNVAVLRNNTKPDSPTYVSDANIDRTHFPPETHRAIDMDPADYLAAEKESRIGPKPEPSARESVRDKNAIIRRMERNVMNSAEAKGTCCKEWASICYIMEMPYSFIYLNPN
jgi:hypothetical protein